MYYNDVLTGGMNMTLEIKEKLIVSNADQKALSLIQKLWEYIILICQQLRKDPSFIQSLMLCIDGEELNLETHKSMEPDNRTIISVVHQDMTEHSTIHTDKTQDEMINELTVFSSRLLFAKTITLEGKYLSDAGVLNGFGTIFWKDFLTENAHDLRSLVSYKNRESLNSDINNTFTFGTPFHHPLSA